MNDLPTASQLQLAMACVGSCVLPRADTVQPAADEGTALHQYLATVAHDQHALELVPEQWRERAASIDLARVPVGLPHEISYAVSEDLASAMFLPSRADYRPGWWCGTADVWQPAVVGEYKTGRVPVPRPRNNWQIKLAALANSLLHTALEDAPISATLYTIKQSGWVDAQTDELDIFDHQHTAAGLRGLQQRIETARAALTAGNVPDLVTGEHCTYCPSLRYCPAQTRLVRGTLATWQDRDSSALDLRHLDDAEIAEAYRHVKTLKAVVTATEKAIYAMASQRSIAFDDKHVLEARETDGNERITSADAVTDAVLAELGADAAAEAVPSQPQCSKAAIDAVCSKYAPRGKAAATKRAIMERLRLAGAVERTPRSTIGVYER